MLDIDSIPLDDQKTWDMICDGNVKGCFQIESHLGKVWCKKVQPRSIEELAAVIAIIRPGCLKSFEDGKSMTQHFADRKNGEEEIPSLHPLIDHILEKTFGVIVFQEQSMEIAKTMAGFTLEEADELRKCLSGDSLVLTNNGPIKISELAKKKQFGKILTINQSGKNVFKKIKRVWSNGFKQTYKITTEKGFSISVTPNHKVFTQNGWVKTQDIKIGDFAAISRNYTFKGKSRNIDLDDTYLTSFLNNHVGSDELQYYLDADFQFSKIVSIEPDKVEEVFDYEVDDDEIHYGFIDGLLVHNSMGKKDANLMSKTLSKFIDGCNKNNIPEPEASRVSEIIEKSNRYAFNLSHSVGYAMESYKSAYLKANYPLTFFCKWLENADEKIDPNREVKELVVAARNEDIEIFGPTLKVREKNFSIQKSAIYFGLLNVKYVGKKEFSKLECLPDTDSWIELLPHIAKINKRSIQALISVGALSFTGMSRSEMLHELKYYCGLTKKEQDWFETNYQSDLNLADNLDRMLEKKKIQSRRKETLRGLIEGLKQPGRSLTDNPVSCVESEEDLLGISLHYSRLDGVDGASYSNATCKEMLDGRESGNVAVVLKEIKEHCTKNNDQMAFITCEDENTLDNVVIFPKQFEEYSDLLYEDNTLILALEKSKTQNSFIVNRVIQI